MLLLRALRSDSLEVKLRLYDARTRRPIVLTGYSGTALIYPAQNSTVAVHALAVDVDQAVAGEPTTGLVTVSLAGGVSLTWIEDAFWALSIGNGSVRKTLVSGPWELRGPAPGPSPYVCGLCPVKGVEQLGVGCEPGRDGYTTLLLPAPQAPSCGC